ncbi:hypothetical protein ACFE04_030388 [Oxalis oulophora]
MAFPRVVCLLFSIILFVGNIIFIDEALANKLQELNGNENISFYEHYEPLWGNNHVTPSFQDRQIQLTMDQSSGSGFKSKLGYGSGFFHMRIRIPNKDTAGVITAYYLTSLDDNVKTHDEFDFEFLGNRIGKPVTLQTNVYTNGVGDREERMNLWFDPSADFHDYRILWNSHQIVFYVDKTPIRVFKNINGVQYPKKPMKVIASLWNGESWATDGGKEKINWNYSPFVASFQGFNVDACVAYDDSSAERCRSDTGYYWNAEKLWKLHKKQRQAYEEVRGKYLNYGYCSDKNRYPTPPPECNQY